MRDRCGANYVDPCGSDAQTEFACRASAIEGGAVDEPIFVTKSPIGSRKRVAVATQPVSSAIRTATRATFELFDMADSIRMRMPKLKLVRRDRSVGAYGISSSPEPYPHASRGGAEAGRLRPRRDDVRVVAGPTTGSVARRHPSTFGGHRLRKRGSAGPRRCRAMVRRCVIRRECGHGKVCRCTDVWRPGSRVDRRVFPHALIRALRSAIRRPKPSRHRSRCAGE